MQSKDSHDFLPFRRQAGDTRTTSLTQAAVAGGAFPAIEAVLLDFHGVLYEDSAWRHWFSNLLRQVGVSTTCDALATFHCDYLHEDNDCEANY